MPNQKLADTQIKDYQGSNRTILSFLDETLVHLYIAEQEKEELIFYRRELAKFIYLLIDEGKYKKGLMQYLDSIPDEIEISEELLIDFVKTLIENIKPFRAGCPDLDIPLQNLRLISSTDEDREKYFEVPETTQDQYINEADEKESEAVCVYGKTTRLYLKKEKGFLGRIKFQLTVWAFQLMDLIAQGKKK